ncbi:MAG: aminotransferase, partial [Bacteroidales bacterium]|nr:aminotransferase [Bacteroidales bacterium]
MKIVEKPMIKAASRTGFVSEYYFSSKLAEIARMRQEGIDVINLGIGSPDMPPASNVIEVLGLSASGSGNHGYQSYRGIPVLRRAFASWYMRYFGVV